MTGAKFRKRFGNLGTFEGEVVGREGKYYQIQYEDGDREEMDEDDLGEYLELPGQSNTTKKRKGLPGSKPGGDKRMVVMGNKVRELGAGVLDNDRVSYVSAAQERLNSGLAAPTVSK